MKRISLVLALTFVLATAARARLGETEEQSAARYGAPTGGQPGTPQQGGPQADARKVLTYIYGGWTIRATFVSKVTVRIEYTGPGSALTKPQVEAVLDAEKGVSHWKPFKEENRGGTGGPGGSGGGPGGPPGGSKGGSGGPGGPIGGQGRGEERPRTWIRGDKAKAKLQTGDLSIIIEHAAFEAWESKQKPAVPRF